MLAYHKIISLNSTKELHLNLESGERKEISLGYKCRLEQTSGTINGESYDAIQRDIVVNHIAMSLALIAKHT